MLTHRAVLSRTHCHSRILASSSSSSGIEEIVSRRHGKREIGHEQRRTFVSRALYRWAKTQMPKISKTEQIALGCGTIGFDSDIFTGNPSLQTLVDKYSPKLTKEEESFLNNEVHELCGMLDDYAISEAKDFPAEVWEFFRKKQFFSLKIPKEWGGKGFSNHAVACILAKLSSRSYESYLTVSVPNSLGPGELLLRYGTAEQKEYYLPKLADGTLIPAFGLTGPHSGSDATSLIGSDGIVERDPTTGALGIRASFSKRYITLAPVAGVLGLGINLKDPNGLLPDDGSATEGFTVALLERHHPGLVVGPRHQPLYAALMNGVVEGEDVWIPLETHVLGGPSQCGHGWKMFVECLAEGRGVGLPAGSVGAGRVVTGAVGAYARVRKQFKVPLANFGGIQEALALAGSDTLINVASGDLMNAIIDNHEAPMVISSIMKQNCTERGRRVLEKGMDVAAGAAIQRGPNNYLANAHANAPISITVEGANIMTRSFQIIGQGLTRCHPHMLPLIESLQAKDGDEDKAVATFMTQFRKVVGHGVTNFSRSVVRGIGSAVSTATRSRTAYKDGDALLNYHEQQLLRLSANFALTADLCFTLGARLKFEELLMGRLTDAMGAIYLGYATLHHYRRRRNEFSTLSKNDTSLEAATEHAMLRLEQEAHVALDGARRNFPGPLGGLCGAVMTLAGLPRGTGGSPGPDDVLTKAVSEALTSTPSNLRTLLGEHCYLDGPEGHRASDLVRALPICIEADRLVAAHRSNGTTPTDDEREIIAKADKIRDKLVQVDVFPELGGTGNAADRPALRQTEEWLQHCETKSFEEFLGLEESDRAVSS